MLVSSRNSIETWQESLSAKFSHEAWGGHHHDREERRETKGMWKAYQKHLLRHKQQHLSQAFLVIFKIVRKNYLYLCDHFLSSASETWRLPKTPSDFRFHVFNSIWSLSRYRVIDAGTGQGTDSCLSISEGEGTQKVSLKSNAFFSPEKKLIEN